MKKFIYILLISFIFIGCSKKIETQIPAYISSIQNNKQNIFVDFKGVDDKRATNIVSTIYNDNKKEAQYPLSNNVKIWYQEGFLRELKNRSLYDKKSNIYVNINIKKLEAKYKKFSLDKKNMQVNIHLELIIKKDKTTITSNININQTKYKAIVLDADGFEDILKEAMFDSIVKTTNVLIEKLK